MAASLAARKSTTYPRFNPETAVRAWAALALFHRLEPREVALQEEGQLERLRSAAMHLPSQTSLSRFLNDLDKFPRWVELGLLKIDLTQEVDPIFSWTSVRNFREFAARVRLEPTGAPKDMLILWRSTPYTATFVEAAEIFYGPQCDGREPERGKVKAWLKSKGWSDRLAGAAASILHTAEQRLGGRPSNT